MNRKYEVFSKCSPEYLEHRCTLQSKSNLLRATTRRRPDQSEPAFFDLPWRRLTERVQRCSLLNRAWRFRNAACWYRFARAETKRLGLNIFTGRRTLTWEKFSCVSDSAAVSSTKAVFNVLVNSEFVGFRIISSISVLLTFKPFANLAQTAAKSLISKKIFGTDSLYGNERG